MATLLSNRMVWAAFLGTASAQLLKVFIVWLSDRVLDWSLLATSGGMPSSHTAAAVALSVSIGRLHSWDSAVFAVALVNTIIVMYDAAGVRRSAGDQARILNILITQFPDLQELQREQLREFLGHTPFEVLAGAALGLIMGSLV
ncbi:MAG: divergent PAP2 family protein [Symbiobacteriaceae bacterium]|nr:divergent PAP2 family protein [Symbiobacteriaceae bacterium]